MQFVCQWPCPYLSPWWDNLQLTLRKIRIIWSRWGYFSQVAASLFKRLQKNPQLIWCHLLRMRWEEFCQHLMFTPVRWVHRGIHSHLITCCHVYCCCLWTGTRRLESGWREMLFSLQQMAQPWPAGDKLWRVLNGCSLPCFQQFPAERIRYCRLFGKLELSPLGILFSSMISKQIASQFVWGSTAGHYQDCTVSAGDGAVGKEAEKSWSCKTFAHRQEGDTSISLLLPDWRQLSSSHGQEEKTHASDQNDNFRAGCHCVA